MQVVNYHDWSERSLNYLCRLFNNLNKGDDYCATLPAIQIGILDFTPFPENPSFYSKNLMMDTETHHVYSSKFAIHVLDLKQINNASSEDKHWGLDNWAKLFKATTWEDVKMIAANNKYLTEAANTMYELYSDREMRRQMENSEDFIRRQKRDQRLLKDQADIIAEKDSALARQADEIARLRAQIETLKKSL
jgi:predicted transposase/invertase (TIGR01784 family)